ncbi:uncharacterized protein LOC124644383 [Helicoverpa zea]|uniref:uncharacterized protein LOC124644383 n=1 Tax=Helicoverpa zea TaxID=7113 RepID=UPI001F590078|nr:uncharacterized protein LOC124644383 [Helicoverpa zea]
MKVCACFLLFTIFALAYCAERLSEEKKKGMKLSLHTVLELDDDKKKDAGLMDIIYNFVKKLSSVLSKKDYKEQGGMRKFREAKDMLFTDFLQEGIEKLNSYKDEDFNEFFAVLNDEIKKYHYRGCKFYELTDNLDTRRLLDAELSFIKGKPMPMTKVNLNALSYILKEEMYDDNVKDFIDHVNSLYKDDSKEKFQKVLNELEQYGVKSKRTDDKLEKIIRDGLRSVIFDHYTNLNVNIRRKLKTKIDKFWSKFRNIKSEKNSEESKDDSDATELKNKPKTLNSKAIVGKSKLSKRDRKIRDILSSDESLSANKDSTLKPVKKKKIISKNLKDESSSLNSEKLSSAETFDSNSIEFSLERQQQYNTQRYATLYTESITGSPKKTAKKAKKIKSRSKPQKKNYRAESKETPTSDTLFGARQKTTPSVLRTKKVDIDLKQKKNDTVINATSSNNTQVLKADDNKLKSVMKETKRQFRDPMEDTDAGSDIAPDSTELTNARKHINSKSKNTLPDHRRTIQVEAAFREISKKRKSTNDTRRSHRNKKDLRRDNSFPLSSIEGLSIEMFKKDRNENLPSRRSATNNKNLNPAEVIFLKRINDLEKKINEVKHKIDVNITRVDKGKGKDDIVKLVGGKVEEKKTKKIEKKSSSKTETELTENNQKMKSGSSTQDAKEDIKDINSNKNIHYDDKSSNITDINKESTSKVRNDTKDNVASSKNEVKSELCPGARFS